MNKILWCVWVLLIGTVMWISPALSMVQAVDEGSVQVIEPWVRALPPTVNNTAAYMIIKNEGAKDIVLVGVRSSAAEVVEIHTMAQSRGMMTMRKIEEVPVQAGTQIELRPGGFHLMLINLTAPLAEGDMVALTLIFDDGRELTVEAEVKRDAEESMEMKGSHGKGSMMKGSMHE